MNANALDEIERISRDMLEAAIREDLQQIIQLQDRQNNLMARIAPAILREKQHEDALRRIIDLNRETSRRVQDRRDEIGDLLRVFADEGSGLTE